MCGGVGVGMGGGGGEADFISSTGAVEDCTVTPTLIDLRRTDASAVVQEQ